MEFVRGMVDQSQDKRSDSSETLQEMEDNVKTDVVGTVSGSVQESVDVDNAGEQMEVDTSESLTPQKCSSSQQLTVAADVHPVSRPSQIIPLESDAAVDPPVNVQLDLQCKSIFDIQSNKKPDGITQNNKVKLEVKGYYESQVSSVQMYTAKHFMHPGGDSKSISGINPLVPLVKKVGSSVVKVPDFFGTQSLDDIDIILSDYGVRTLNMDMLTKKQFSLFLKKFGSDLQQA